MPILLLDESLPKEHYSALLDTSDTGFFEHLSGLGMVYCLSREVLTSYA